MVGKSHEFSRQDLVGHSFLKSTTESVALETLDDEDLDDVRKTFNESQNRTANDSEASARELPKFGSDEEN